MMQYRRLSWEGSVAQGSMPRKTFAGLVAFAAAPYFMLEFGTIIATSYVGRSSSGNFTQPEQYAGEIEDE